MGHNFLYLTVFWCFLIIAIIFYYLSILSCLVPVTLPLYPGLSAHPQSYPPVNRGDLRSNVKVKSILDVKEVNWKIDFTEINKKNYTLDWL